MRGRGVMSDSVWVTAEYLICYGLKLAHTYLFWESSYQALRKKGGIREAVVVQILTNSLRQKTLHGLTTGSSPSTRFAEQCHSKGVQRKLCTNLTRSGILCTRHADVRHIASLITCGTAISCTLGANFQVCSICHGAVFNVCLIVVHPKLFPAIPAS